MLDPTLFENNLDNYPLTWDDVQPKVFSQVPPEEIVSEKRSGNDIVLKYITNVQSENGSVLISNFLKIATNMVDTW